MAVMVLEPSFGSEEMAQALAINSSKNIIRRHLTSEMTALIITTRYVKQYQATYKGRGPEDNYL
jgi:hypothetical protein